MLRRVAMGMVLALGLNALVSAAAPAKNLAYELSFAWHVAKVLTDDLWQQVGLGRQGLPPDQASQFRFEFELVYVQDMVACGGAPLDALAQTLRDLAVPDDPSDKVAAVTTAFAERGERLWPALREWDRSARPRVLLRHAQDGLSLPWPRCIHEGVRRQDQVLATLPRE